MRVSESLDRIGKHSPLYDLLLTKDEDEPRVRGYASVAALADCAGSGMRKNTALVELAKLYRADRLRPMALLIGFALDQHWSVEG
ncbi:MAG: hypothetical protein E6G34_11715 [Actinobacteria bacterium]|nr:MAG: hypothetical protein E6G34_11715 [Actinomycetota bacterium]